VDGVVAVKEVIDVARKSKKECHIFKVDFEKAYDSVSWNFLEYMMVRLGFSGRWRSWIRACAFCGRLSILVNGSWGGLVWGTFVRLTLPFWPNGAGGFCKGMEEFGEISLWPVMERVSPRFTLVGGRLVSEGCPRGDLISAFWGMTGRLLGTGSRMGRLELLVMVARLSSGMTCGVVRPSLEIGSPASFSYPFRWMVEWGI